MQVNPLPTGLSAAIAVGGALAVAASTPSTALALPSRIIAYTGGPVPGMPDRVISGFGGTGLFAPPVLNASGEVAFWSNLSDPGSQFGGTGVIWSTAPGQLAPVAMEGTSAPSGGTYTSFSRRLLLDDAGHVAFGGVVDGTDLALFAQGSDGLRTVVREGQIVPQSDPISPVFGYEFTSLGANFGTVYNGNPYVFNGGRVAFGANAASPDDPGSGIGPVTGIWGERPTIFPRELQVIVRDGEDTDFSVSTGSQPSAMNGLGETFLHVNTVAPNPDNPDVMVPIQAIVADTYGGFVFVAQTDADAGGDASITSLGNHPGVNDAGNVAFQTRFNDLGGSDDSGIFKQFPGGGPAGVVVTEGAVAPGTDDINGDGTPDFVFGDLAANNGASPLINANGNVAFEATVAHPNNTEAHSVIYTDRDGGLLQLDLVAEQFDEAPGLPQGSIFTSLAPLGPNSIVINDDDAVAFQANFETPGGSEGTGIWVDRDGVLILAAKAVNQTGSDGLTGDVFTLPDGTTTTASFLQFAGGSGNQDGRPSGFGDNGEIAFRVIGSDDAIVSVFVPIPGDANGDGTVSLADFLILRSHFGSSDGVSFDEGDFNGDGTVSLADFLILRGNFGNSSDGNNAPGLGALPATVPEPAGLSLLEVAGLALLRRRRS